MRRFQRYFAAIAALGIGLAQSEPADACGGFFCSSQQPVNQAAERIIFADNGDGTMTVVIQILYQGPSEKFSWLLPISSVPAPDQIAVSSDMAFSLLQQATNPRYTLNQRQTGRCRERWNVNDSAGNFSGVAASPRAPDSLDDDVTLEASGEVGAFQYSVISVGPDAPDPAAPALQWLQLNGYDVTPEGTALIGPYLADGMNLLALRLTKGSDTGSIRPIQLTYPADAASIPIRLTAVAANRDMGVLAWVLGSSRAVPFNYNSLELNEARLNWFSPFSSYDQVVTEAADAVGGQGFVTELAEPTTELANLVWSSASETRWLALQQQSFSSLDEVFRSVLGNFGGRFPQAGFWDAARRVVVLPEDVSFDDFKACPTCFPGRIDFSPSKLYEALDQELMEPLRSMQRLFDRSAYVTRLYTTLSADEMQVDPIFRFNPDLPDVSNLHVATLVTECRDDLYVEQAPWRIELPGGAVLRGTPGAPGTWPASTAELPPNSRVLMLSTSGEGRLLEDNTADIESQIATYNATVPTPVERGGFCGVAVPVRGASKPVACALGLALLLLRGHRRRR